jgi:hypothetical protein
MKLHTGAKTDLLSTLKRKLKRAIRPKLARSTMPFNWQFDPITIQNRLNALGPIPIKNQFQSDSCGGQAGAYWLGIALAIKNGTKYQEVSAKSVYSPIAYPGGGTTDTALQNQIENKGALTEALVPSYTPQGTTTEAWMTDTSWETPPNEILCAADAGWVEVTVENDLNAIAEAIRDHGATVWHIQGDFYDQRWLTATPPLPPPNFSPLEGHFMCQHNVGANAIISLQSWGTDVGNNGTQTFTTNDFIGSPYLVDIFTFAPKYVPSPTVPGQLLPNPAILTWQQRLFDFFLSLFSTGQNS